MARKQSKTTKPKVRRVPTNCWFCAESVAPDFKKIDQLEKFTTDRGKIIPRSRSGVCPKHQRRLNKAIKRARFLALLPFVSRV